MRVAPSDIFLICPVRNLEPAEKGKIDKYVSDLEKNGNKVHWPPRDTDQIDPVGLRICQDNRDAIAQAKKVKVWWNPQSQGSLFDLGIAFGMEKNITLANPESVQPTDGKKSFNNVLLALHELNSSKVESLAL